MKKIIFCVNIADYDQGLKANKLVQSIDYFDSIINLPCFRNYGTSVYLLLTHADEFREKLANSPLAKHFPDFRGSCDAKQAEQFVIERFQQVQRRARLRMRHRVTQLVEMEDIHHIFERIGPLEAYDILAQSGLL